jgi:hypothetical protein
MKTPFLRTSLPLVVGLALVTVVAAAAGSPMSQWMRANMAAVLPAEDFGTLQKNFDFLSTKQPGPNYADWAKFAKKGSAAAAKKDGVAAKAACDGCHDAYRPQYKKEFPTTRPFP